MPSRFAKSNQPPTKASISRPIPSMDNPQHDSYLIRSPNTPAPIPLSRPPPPPLRGTTTPAAGRTFEDNHNPQSKFHEHLESPRPVASTYPLSEYEDDNRSMLSSCPPSPATMHPNKYLYRSERPSRPVNATMEFPTTRREQLQDSKQLPPVPHNQALVRGLTKRYAANNNNTTAAGLPAAMFGRQDVYGAASMPRPSGVRTRTDTRRQGFWLRQGTVRVDMAELKKQEKELLKLKLKDDKNAEKSRLKAEKEFRKAEKGKNKDRGVEYDV